ncbi:MAG: hypothetical protein GWP69_18750 [Gammaproteobacteria bacterium]|nr:hypothetical protein [Gammaproteobacteria bacterium]
MIYNGPRLAGLTMLSLAAALAAVLWLSNGSAEIAAVAPDTNLGSVDDTAVALAPVFTLPEPDQFHSLAERPLFVANRRPPEPVAEKKAVSKPAPKPARRPEFILSAIVREGNHWIAVLGARGRGNPPPMEVEVGAVVAGWKVERIGADGVVLRKGAQRTELTLRTY